MSRGIEGTANAICCDVYAHGRVPKSGGLEIIESPTETDFGVEVKRVLIDVFADVVQPRDAYRLRGLIMEAHGP